MKRLAKSSARGGSVPPVVRWSGGGYSRELRRLLGRPAVCPRAERTARRIIAEIEKRGDAALVELELQLDGCRLTPGRLRVDTETLASAGRRLPPSFRRMAREAHRRILVCARRELNRDWEMGTPYGGHIGERFVPYDRVGVYVPGGVSPLASTALMTVTLAKAAGVPQIVACSPPCHSGDIHPAVLFCLRMAGATEVYRLGGIQAIAAMALGTRSIRPVRKIVGPGGAYVTAAKKLLYGRVALDMIAGPSEIAVLADSTAAAPLVAADLLSQAEHGTGEEKALLVTDSPQLARAVQRELQRQVHQLPEAQAAMRVLQRGTALVVVPDLQLGVELCNRFAPEHLEVMVRRPQIVLRRVQAAGAVFVGRWTPEAVGDYAAGPSHVLPTGGSAALFSGLTARDFQRRMSVVHYTRRDLEEADGVIQAFAEMERLAGHGRASAARLARGRGRTR